MNHIKVELDFIPVEERLPEVGKEVYLKRGQCIRIGYWDADETEEAAWWMTDEGEYLGMAHFTHWAEIPEMK